MGWGDGGRGCGWVGEGWCDEGSVERSGGVYRAGDGFLRLKGGDVVCLGGRRRLMRLIMSLEYDDGEVPRIQGWRCMVTALNALALRSLLLRRPSRLRTAC